MRFFQLRLVGKTSRILLSRMQDPQYVDDIAAYLINNNVVWVHNVFTGTSDAPKPKQIRHKRQVFGRLNDGSIKVSCSRRVSLLYKVNDFHQVGGGLVRPTNGLHGLCDDRLTWPEPWPLQRRAVIEAFRYAKPPQPWRETTDRSWPLALQSRTRKRLGKAFHSCGKD